MGQASLNHSITLERLRSLLRYDPETGLFVWLESRRKVRVGDVADHHCSSGHVQITIDGRGYMAHRLAWFYMTGAWPKVDIDHIDTVRDNNRWVNLREATRSQNCANTALRVNNTSGLKGVTWHKQRGKWVAQIRFEGRHIHLGSFTSKQVAHQVYLAKARELFGAYARAA